MSEEKFTFFWDGPFSQWLRGFSFKVDDVEYSTAEQYMMAEKARLFDDNATLKKIMATSSPKEQKALGREVKNFDAGKWNAVAKDVVKKANLAKFRQNPKLKDQLLATEGTTLVEASPYDKIWGIGLRENDARALDRQTWQGTNWLGEVLTQVREEIKCDT
tara:strand:+ start:2916 stop:3398 length:483 start_codon:yes stop_codon:yes gene_type:complete